MKTQTRKNKNKTRTTMNKVNTKSKTKTKSNSKFLVYSENDYNSGDGMLTTVWGPSMWHYLHIMSFNYPINPTKADKKHYRDFIINLQYVLPCKYCRQNLTNNLKKLPLTMNSMSSRDSFSRYVYELHEHINNMLKKPSNLTFEEVRDRYEHFRSRCTDPPKIYDLKNNDKVSVELEKTQEKIEEKTEDKTQEKGCTEPLYGKKSKCIIKIVPQEEKGASFQMDKKCIKFKPGNI
jgi:hypothetical protein